MVAIPLVRSPFTELSPVTTATLLKPPRRDALPEHTSYVDSGCDLHDSCLTCPLARCRYDEPGGARKVFSEERDRGIIRLRLEEEMEIDAIACRYGISRRTVFRVLARERSAR